MVYRYGWLSGAANLLFALFLLDRLLRGSVAGPPWQVVVGGAAVVGGALTWLLLALPRRIPLPALAVVHGAVFALVVVAVLGGLPTDGDAWIAATEQLSRAVALVRNGVEPVVPLPGLVAILAGLFWAVGALAVWGLRTGHPFVALLPPLALAAQFVTIDRAATSLVLVAVFVGLVAATILAVDADERGRGAGAMAALTTERTRRRLPGLGSVLVVGLSFFGALTASTVLADVVPRDGALEWRTATGLTGDFFGSVAYNPFVDIQKGLVSREGIPLFAARIEGEARPSEIYFRLLTLETYEDGRWFADRPKVYPLDERPWEDPAAAFAGPTAQVVADVEILGLAMDWLPAPYLPVAFEARSSTLEGNVLVRRFDGSLVFEGGRTATGDRYTVVAEIPRPDLAALAAEPDGDLSPLFATASAEHPVPEPAALPRREPPGRARLVDVPADLDPRIGAKARELTERLTTPFEKGLALEKWFRSSGGFVYDVEVTPGHDVESVGAWLFDATDNPDYRRGYCEQFATAMALMARTLDIPSRVVLGFTPGTPAGDGVVVVLDNNAHAWVELWMPTQGWVRFDPTPRSDGANPITYETVNAALGFDLTEYLDQVPEPIRPRIETPGAAPPVIARDDEPERVFVAGGGETDREGPRLPTAALPWLGAVVVAVAVVGAVPAVKWYRRRRRLARLRRGDITAAWEDIVARLEDLGDPPDPAATPLEAARAHGEELVPLAALYSQTIYGGVATDDRRRLAATVAYRRTLAAIAERYPAGRRLAAWYRVRWPRLSRSRLPRRRPPRPS